MHTITAVHNLALGFHRPILFSALVHASPADAHDATDTDGCDANAIIVSRSGPCVSAHVCTPRASDGGARSE